MVARHSSIRASPRICLSQLNLLRPSVLWLRFHSLILAVNLGIEIYFSGVGLRVWLVWDGVDEVGCGGDVL